MIYGIGGTFGVVSDEESAICRTAEADLGSNPTLTARIKSIA